MHIYDIICEHIDSTRRKKSSECWVSQSLHGGIGNSKDNLGAASGGWVPGDAIGKLPPAVGLQPASPWKAANGGYMEEKNSIYWSASLYCSELQIIGLSVSFKIHNIVCKGSHDAASWADGHSWQNQLASFGQQLCAVGQANFMGVMSWRESAPTNKPTAKWKSFLFLFESTKQPKSKSIGNYRKLWAIIGNCRWVLIISYIIYMVRLVSNILG